MSMAAVEDLITENIDVWTSAIKRKSIAGRGGGKKIELYGVKKLRELILDLAVRGLLVSQDPNDEPASVLLERIAAEKAKLIATKKVKKTKTLPAINEKEKPFELPVGWEWTRLGFVGVCSTGKTPSTKEPMFFNGTTPFIGPGQITIDGNILPSDKHLSSEGIKNSTSASKGDLLMVCIGGSIGKSAICDKELTFNQQINSISPILLNSTYLRTAISTNRFQKSVLEKSSGSATPIINRSKWEELLIPICTHQEQHRIVAKVDELMALCDQLEQQTESSLTAHQTLVQTLLGALTQAAATQPKNDQQNATDAPTPFTQAWNRLSEHFDTVFTTEDSIEQLKQTILQLAVMGKLVPQNPKDEPASELLKRIATEKDELVKAKKIKKQKALPEIGEEEKPFVLPSGWEWCRVDSLFNIIVDCPHSTAKFTDTGVLCLDTNSFKRGKLQPEKFRFVSMETYNDRNLRLIPKPRDIVFAREGSVGESVVIPEGITCCLGQRVMLFRPSIRLNSDYLRLTLSNDGAIEMLLSMHKGIGAKHVNVRDMKLFIVALPPESEQIKITQRVDELIALCDQLKAQLFRAQSTQLQLANVVTEQAIQ